jgi:hypothetical protein
MITGVINCIFMNNLMNGIVAGLVFGILDVLLMIPIPMNDKAVAMLASFIGRFAIGFLVATTNLPVAPWMKGLIIGLLLSLPDAIITKQFIPIIGVGVVGGIICGILVGK